MDDIYCGKRISDGGWIFGSLLVLKRYSSDIDHYFVIPNDPSWYLDPKFSSFEVDPETVCQSIGMEDDFGNTIFENDIIEVECSCSETMRYRMRIMPSISAGEFYIQEASVGRVMHYIQRDVLADEETFEKSDCETWRVVGNTIDQPERFRPVHGSLQ